MELMIEPLPEVTKLPLLRHDQRLVESVFDKFPQYWPKDLWIDAKYDTISHNRSRRPCCIVSDDFDHNLFGAWTMVDQLVQTWLERIDGKVQLSLGSPFHRTLPHADTDF